MPFQQDLALAEDVGPVFGQYVESFFSEGGQVRADLFRRGRVVVAYVAFPTGLDAGSVTDRYVSALWDYARAHEFQDNFKLVLT